MDNRQNRVINNNEIIAWNDPRIALLRSKTYSGIAKAMAVQWSEFISNPLENQLKFNFQT